MTRKPKALEVIRKGHPTIGSRAKEVENPTDPKIQEIIDDIRATIEVIGPASGLAAPQVNIPLRIFLFQIPEENLDETPTVFRVAINPTLEPLSDEKVLGWEGCFSLPYLVGEVPRYKHIRYSYTTPEGEIITQTASDYHARIIQHELDHLDGITYVQRMTNMTRFGYLEEVRQYMIQPTDLVDES